MQPESAETTPPLDLTSNPEPTAAEVLTVEDLAKLLRVSEKTIYAAIKAGEIPGVRKIGTVIRISRAAVIRWLDDGDATTKRRKR